MSKRKTTINTSISLPPELKRKAEKRIAELQAKAGPGFTITFSSYINMLLQADLEASGLDDPKSKKAA